MCKILDIVTPVGGQLMMVFIFLQGHSRDVYHTKRMFKVSCVVWSGDNKYILSGSSDHNVRVWKSKSNEKMGVVSITYFVFLV